MSALTRSEKLNICARLFFEDNKDQYPDFRSAQVEFMSIGPSDSFIDFAIKGALKAELGEAIFINPTSGHIIAHRISDGWTYPKTEMSEEEGAEIMESTLNLASENLDWNVYQIFESIGWKTA